MLSNFNAEFEFLKDAYTDKINYIYSNNIEDLIEKDDGSFKKYVSASGIFRLSDWRRTLIEKYPFLIFITCFKLADVIVDNIISIKSSANFTERNEELRKLEIPPTGKGFLSDTKFLKLFKHFYSSYLIARNKIIHETKHSFDNGILTVSWIDKKTQIPEQKEISLEEIEKIAISLVLCFDSLNVTTIDQRLLNKATYDLADVLHGTENPHKINEYFEIKLNKIVGGFINYNFHNVKENLISEKNHPIFDILVDTDIGLIRIPYSIIEINPSGISIEAAEELKI